MGEVNYRNLDKIHLGHANHQKRLVLLVTFIVNAVTIGMILSIRMGGINDGGIYFGIYVFMVPVGWMMHRWLWADYMQACRESHPPTESGEAIWLPQPGGGMVRRPVSGAGGSK